MNPILKVIGGLLSAAAIGGGAYINSQKDTLLQKAVTTIAEQVSEKIGTQVKIGKIKVSELNLAEMKNSGLIVNDVEIFDKNSELIAKVDEADIKFKLLALADDELGAIDEIDIKGAQLDLKKRDDETWNFSDIKPSGEGESNFGAKINLSDGKINAEFDGKKISVEEISAEADCADLDAIETKASAKVLGSQLEMTGTLGAKKQIVHASLDSADVQKILPYLPEGTLPENVEIKTGTVKNPKIHVTRDGNILNYLGSAELSGGAVKVEDTEIENIDGSATFNKDEIFFNASGQAAGQAANASGVVRLDTDELFFDVRADAKNFSPSAIIENLGIDGAADVVAHMTGTAKNPQVEAKIFSPAMTYENLSAKNISTKLRYNGETIFLTDLQAETFGGSVEGEAQIQTDDLTYIAHVKAHELDVTQLRNFAEVSAEISGKLSGDMELNGSGKNFDDTKIFGTAQVARVNFLGFPVEHATASFLLNGKNNLSIDNLNALLVNRGKIGVEGTITDGHKLDLNFYGAHVDLSLAKNFGEKLDISGLADFTGEVHGDAENPQVNLLLSAMDGSRRDGEKFRGNIFKQPFNSMELKVSGSMDGIQIENFELEKDGKIIWESVEGVVGLTGEKKIDLALKTSDARLENIMALLAPDLEVQGTLDNLVKITGTLDAPNVVGEVALKYGTYKDFFISGVTGNYFFEGDLLRLQNFKINSPLTDVTLNGTFNTSTKALNFVAEGEKLDLARLPKKNLSVDYTATGNLKFEGLLTGTTDHPIFDGQINSDKLQLNEIDLTDVHAHAELDGNQITFDELTLVQGDGTLKGYLTSNIDTENLNGNIDVADFDLRALFGLAGTQTELVTGQLDSKIIIGGNFSRPSVSVTGDLSKGELAGYDLHNVNLQVSYLNDIIYVQKLAGFQGAEGIFNLSGSAKIDGPIDLNFVSENLDLGIFPSAAGLETDSNGKANITAKIGGNTDNPEAEINLHASGEISGATFDAIDSEITFKDWIFDIKNFTVQRMIGEMNYKLSAEGILPYEALLIKPKPKDSLAQSADLAEAISVPRQMNLKISLDGADLSLLPVIAKPIRWAVGDMDGNLTITGTAASPLINGKISVSDGTIKVKGMSNMIEHINISTLFNGDRFDVENFVANIGAGKFILTGGFSFADMDFSDYNFSMTADALDIRSDVFTGPLNGEFTLSEGIFHGQKVPKLSGHLDLDRCIFSVPTLPDSDDPLWEMLLDVTFNLGNKVHFYSSRLYDMFLTGSVRFNGSTKLFDDGNGGQYMAFLNPSGSINVKRGGTLTYLQNVFDIKEGEAHFNQQGSFMPTLHFFAETRLTKTKIFIYIDGPLEKEVKFKLGSSPEMSETEIIQLLTLRDAYDKDKQTFTAADALEIGLQMSVLAEIEDTVKRRLGLDKFMVTRGNGSAFDSYAQEEDHHQTEFNVSMGKYISDKVMLRYTQGINGDRISRYGFQYDINDNLGVTIEREDNEFIFGLEARYNF